MSTVLVGPDEYGAVVKLERRVEDFTNTRSTSFVARTLVKYALLRCAEMPSDKARALLGKCLPPMHLPEGTCVTFNLGSHWPNKEFKDLRARFFWGVSNSRVERALLRFAVQQIAEENWDEVLQFFVACADLPGARRGRPRRKEDLSREALHEKILLLQTAARSDRERIDTLEKQIRALRSD